MPVLNQKPLIEILTIDEQHDRMDIPYYLPEFVESEKFLDNLPCSMTTLGEIMTDDASYGVLPPSSCYCEEGIYLVRSSNVSNGGVDYESAVKVPVEWINKERAKIKQDDILISIKGARAFFDMCVVNDTPPEAIVNGSLFRFQCKHEYDPNFVVLWLLSKPIQNLVFRERTNLGISYISLDILNTIPVPSINIDKQKIITDKFQSAMNIGMKIRSFKETISKKIVSQTSILLKIFDDELGITYPKGSKDKIRIVPAKNIQDRLDWKTYDPNLISDVNKLSKNFSSIIKFNDIASLIDNYFPPTEITDSEVKLIRVKWHGLGAELREIKEPKNISGHVAKATTGDVILSRIDITQGAVAIIPVDLNDGVVTKEFFLLKINNDSYSNELIKRILLHKRYNQFFLSSRTGATKRLRLDKNVLMSLPLPGIERQKQIKILKKITSIENKINKLQSISFDADVKYDELINLVLSKIMALLDKNIMSYLQKTANAWIETLEANIEETLQ